MDLIPFAMTLSLSLDMHSFQLFSKIIELLVDPRPRVYAEIRVQSINSRTTILLLRKQSHSIAFSTAKIPANLMIDPIACRFPYPYAYLERAIIIIKMLKRFTKELNDFKEKPSSNIHFLSYTHEVGQPVLLLVRIIGPKDSLYEHTNFNMEV